MWTYNSIRIYVQELGEVSNQVIARIQPLQGTTVLQIFGDEAPIHKVTAKVVGTTNLNALKALINDGVAYTLSGYFFNESLYLKGLDIKRDTAIMQTIDQTQDCYTPVFTVNLELYQE